LTKTKQRFGEQKLDGPTNSVQHVKVAISTIKEIISTQKEVMKGGESPLPGSVTTKTTTRTSHVNSTFTRIVNKTNGSTNNASKKRHVTPKRD